MISKMMAGSLLIVSMLLFFSSAAFSAPVGFQLNKGWVAYHIDGKMFGFAAHPVDAVSQQIQGEVHYLGDPLTGNILASNITGTLVIPVKSLKSGDNALDANVVNTLKGDKYPDITFELIDTFISEDDMDNLTGASASVNVRKLKAKLSVAGVSKIYDFDIKVEKLKDDKYRLSTAKEIKFTDFGITPPSMGAISVLPDQIFIKGELIFEKK